MKNIWLVIVLMLIGGAIIWFSTIVKPTAVPEKPPVVEAKPIPEAHTTTILPAKAEPVSARKQLDDTFNKGLKWFMAKQLPDGAFPDLEGKSDVAFTAMGLIILAESPEDVRNAYQAQITSAVNYLLPRQTETGAVIDAGKFPAFEVYKTSLALVALRTVSKEKQVSELDKTTAALLERKVTFPFKEPTALAEIIKFIKETVPGIDIQIDTTAIKDTQVTFCYNVVDIPLGWALKDMLSLVDWSYSVKDGVVIISSRPPVNNSVAGRIEAVIKKATEYLVKSQNGPESADKDFGGWGYDEKKGTVNANLSTTAYAMDALHLAGLPKDSEVYKRAVEFLAKVQDSSEYNKFRATENSGGFSYSPVESKGGEKTTPDGKKVLKTYGSMTYAGVKSFIYAYLDKNDPRVQAAYNWIKSNYTLDENPGLRTDAEPNLGKQGLFYYYHTFAKSLDAYGEKTLVTADLSAGQAGKKEHLWANELVGKLAGMQKPDGSWSNEVSRWWEDFAPLATSYSLMSLNICRKWSD
ncbi:MAG: prenyltransferase/squalene oxidase repeat-containing protein [Planctomycetota bacterium]